MRWRRKITDKRLCYAAIERCSCGAGLAYTRKMNTWECSDLLKGEALPGTKHIGPIPFKERWIKSENQPSANGETTRPPTIKQIMAALADFDKRIREP